MDRRNFIKTLGMGAGAALLPQTVRAEKPEELCTLLDLSKCIGCGECVYACREANSHKYPEPKKPFPTMYPTTRAKAEDFSDNRDDDTRLTPYNWLYIQSATVNYNGEEHEIHIPRRCMHCTNPPCANLCPWGSCYRQKNGAVIINPDVCLGGAKCRNVCPWHIPQRQTGVGLYLDILPNLAGNGVMYKCDRCKGRLEKGETPACIEACPENVQTIGPRAEMIARAQDLAKSINGFIYGLNDNGGTNTVYVSPVPFDLLNRKVETGPGRPTMDPMSNSMAKEDNLAYAVLMAPIAGAAAAMLTTAKGMGNKEDDNE